MSFEAFELEIAANYPVCTWTENGSCEISGADRCLFSLSTWLCTRSSTATQRMCGLPLSGCQTLVALTMLWIRFNRLSMLPAFQPLSRNSLSILRAPYCCDRDFKSESHLPVKFSWFCLIFLQIFGSRQFPNVGAWNRWGGKIKTPVDGLYSQ